MAAATSASSSESRVAFPPGLHFALTWSIPDDFGGMTSALLHRSRAFVRLGGVSVDILTFDRRPDYPEVEARWRERGELIDGMRLLNLWDWLDANLIGPLPEKGSWRLYRFWLDQLRQRRPSFLIVDSKTVARMLTTYRRKRAVTVHVVHNSHLNADGTLRESRRTVFENLGAFDSVVLLTERQRTDVERMLGPQPTLTVIGNSRDPVPPSRRVDRAGGLLLGSLDTRKRVDHAIRAIAAADATLDIYGEGPEHSRLDALITELGARATLHGHTPNARDRLAAASFLLLTSRSEGFPLVLLEAMAAGCIPIAYDTDYGPSEIIRHGRNGMLVPPGDVAALSAAVRELEGRPPRQLSRMRRAARRAASEHSDLAVTRAWARELGRAEARKLAAWGQARRAG